ncbi:MAG TPA: hypothetical protein VGK97_06225 [Spongiibacteraceae bacterium]|jgi:hypothetical protein
MNDMGKRREQCLIAFLAIVLQSKAFSADEVLHDAETYCEKRIQELEVMHLADKRFITVLAFLSAGAGAAGASTLAAHRVWAAIAGLSGSAAGASGILQSNGFGTAQANLLALRKIESEHITNYYTAEVKDGGNLAKVKEKIAADMYVQCVALPQ